MGAALSEIALTADGKFPALEQFEEVRVNLTGYSANCVERIGDELVTISGYSNGGINKFALNDVSNQEKNFINASRLYKTSARINSGVFNPNAVK